MRNISFPRFIAALLIAVGLPLSVYATCPPVLDWSTAYADGQISGITGLTMDKHGDLLAVGYHSNTLYADFDVRKYDSNGTLVWSATWNPTVNYLIDPYGLPTNACLPFGVATDSNKNVIVVGRGGGSPTLAASVWLVKKYSVDGNIVWSRTFFMPSDGYDQANGVVVDAQDNIIVAGRQMDYAQTYKVWNIHKYSQNGDVLWTTTIPGRVPLGWNVALGEANAVTLDHDGHLLVTGLLTLGSGTTFAGGAVVVKYNATGSVVWSRTFKGTGNAIATDQCGNVFVTGMGPGGKGQVIRYSGDGDLTWTRTQQLGGLNTYSKGVATFDTRVLVVSQAQTSTPGKYIWLMNLYRNSDGSNLCQWTYDGANPYTSYTSDTATAVLIDSHGNAIVGGMRTDGPASFPVYASVIQSYALEIDNTPFPCFPVPAPPEPIDPGKVKVVGGVRGYLDPKQGEEATILVRPAQAGTIRVRIYDMTGALLKEMTRETTGGHTEVIGWNTTDASGTPVPAGVYPMFIEAPGIKYRDKLVVVR